ncbi:MAG: Rrf2 family transcriptional regulator [Planctomycetaceae bacterium]|jgi:Rrf2 family protein|nr:Rrf2 family transcriptional regulator [Planctomycetaceae bacterium]
MKISVYGWSSLRMMVDLGLCVGGEFVPSRLVAERQGLSRKYLERIAVNLCRAGLVAASRGSQGGYKLARPAEKITVGEIWAVTEGGLLAKGNNDAEKKIGKGTNIDEVFIEMGNELSEVMIGFVGGISLREVIERCRERGEGDYCI